MSFVLIMVTCQSKTPPGEISSYRKHNHTGNFRRDPRVHVAYLTTSSEGKKYTFDWLQLNKREKTDKFEKQHFGLIGYSMMEQGFFKVALKVTIHFKTSIVFDI